ncbi:MAG: hypothetical protein ACLGI2_07465 [Acidimicrobiia bacterium]
MPFDPTSGAMDVILGIAALATLIGFVRARRSFWDDQFTVEDRRLATQVAVFLVPPVVVLLHELGHFFTAKALGVRVTGFEYGLFHGSVTVAGPRTVEDMWLIALSGNVVGAAVGLVMVVAGMAGTGLRRPLRYLLVAGGMLELLFSLVVYPVLSLSANFGDWVMLYSRRTQTWSVMLGVVHAASLLALFMWWRSRGKAALFAIGSSAEKEIGELRAAVDSVPTDPSRWLALADFYARRGELSLARSTVEEGISACGDVPRLLLGLTRLSMFQGRWNDAVLAARRGLEADAPDEVRQPLWANLALALTQMERPEHALPAYGNLKPPVLDDVRVRYGRGLVRMESGDEGGREDLEAVVRTLPEGNLLRRWAEARLEGHPLRDWVDTRVPAYQRSSTPPPAPLAGV